MGAMLLGIGYCSQLRYSPAKEAQSGLDNINRWRVQAGLQALRLSPELQQAAQSHAAYLGKDAHGHDEINQRNPHYTGADPQARATAAGYSAPVVENLTVGNWARSGNRSADSLMTALYHRLGLLTPDHDEAGVAWVRSRNAAFVVVQGSSQDRELCDRAGSRAQRRYVLTMLCDGEKTEIPLDVPPRRYSGAVKYPIGNNIEPSYDGKEVPNPMPTRKAVGNPVSISLHGSNAPIEMRAFILRSPKGEVSNTTILTAATDPNRLLHPNEFALFAPKPLDFNTEYTAEFRYTQDGQAHVETWTFRTRKRRHWLEW